MDKKIIGILITSIIVIASFSGCQEETKKEPAEKTNTELAMDFLYEIKSGDLNEAYTYFSSIMTSQFSMNQFRNTWKTITDTYGDFETIEDSEETVIDGLDVVFVNCTFSNDYYIIFKLVFDELKEISGFWTEKIEPISSYSAPDYADVNSFTEKEITIGEEPWKLPGTISIPNGEGPFASVILVHGSGPSDRDESVGVNKPFKDIAWGLATKNIIVLRYDKRTKVYPEETAVLTNFTLEEEIIEDVYAAIDYLKTEDNVNQSQIFVLGHSLGAMAAPQIAVNNQDISGIIMLGAAARGLEDLIYNQTVYLSELDGVIDETEQATIDLINESIEKIKTLNISEGELVLGVYKSYWEYLNNYLPVRTAEALTIPMMIVQGLRDYQVSYEYDYQVWNETFFDNSDVFLKTYESLNHLFIAGSGTPTNTEYLDEGHVAEEVIVDISNFIAGET